MHKQSDGDVVTDMPIVICGWTDESSLFEDGVRKATADIYRMWLGSVRVTVSGRVQVPYCPPR